MQLNSSLTLGCMLIALLLGGCASEMAMRTADESFTLGEYEASILTLQAAMTDDPGNGRLRARYLGTRERAINRLISDAEFARMQGKDAEARPIYQRILQIDRDNARAQNGLKLLDRGLQHNELIDQARDDLTKNNQTRLAETVRQILTENTNHVDAQTLKYVLDKQAQQKPESKISKALQKTLSIDFSNAMLKQVIEVFSRTTGVNFVFDKDVKTDQKVTVFLNKTSVREALDVVLFTNQLEQRELDTNTILIYPNTPPKLKDYQPLTVRGFFLTHSEPEQVSAALKSILKLKEVVVDKRQNMLTVRDTPEAVRMAEKLVTLLDLPEPEVMLDVEIMEINRNRLLELGVKFPDQLTLSPLPKTSGGSVTLNDLKNLSSTGLGATLTPLTINAKRQTGDVNLLANPRIRARNRSTAKVMIGDKVPSITTTATTTYVGTNVQYLDIGLKLEVVPTITIGNEIAIKISLEVSNIANQVTIKDTVAYQIGTRSASTILTLKDGETQVLAGLLSDDERHSANKIPGLGDLPLLGRLFGSNLQDSKKTEIVLSITPRLIRSADRPDLSIIEFDSGTETNLRRPASAPARADSKADKAEKIEGTASTAGNGAQADSPAKAGNSLSLPPAAEPATRQEAEPTPAGQPQASWSLPASIKPGETFSATLNLQDVKGLTGIPIAISYDPSQLEATRISEGSLLASNGGSTAFSQKIDRAAGMLYITGTRNARDGDTGANGSGPVASIDFKALGNSGSTSLKVITLAPLGLNGSSLSIPAPAAATVNIQTAAQ